ncbi:MAG: HlyD family efflux transporter periplasmic adaptor subunit [Clostridia bacterium]
MEKKIRKGRVFAVVLILALVFIYAVYLVAKLVQNPTNTFMVTNGKISQEESDIGYIIREETVVKGQNYKNGMVKIKNEGEKVAKGDSVFRYYSSGEEELKNKIAELDVEIQSLMQNEKSSFPSDVKLLESQIEKELDSIYGLNNAQKIQEYKKNINSYITKKAKISSPSNSRLKELLRQREEYENRLTSDSENVNAPESGIVSYRVDGLESVLTTEDFTKFNKSFLQDLKLKTGQTVASNEEVGKIINNYQCYIVFNSNTNEAKNSKVGDTIKIRVQNSDTLKASVENIIDEDDESKTITVKITNDVEKLIAYRKISFDIIWWDAEGFRIPNEAIKEENGLSYVVRNRNGYYNKMLVKILKQNDEYCIVRQYKTEELEELGFTSSQIYSMRNIALYDEIVLNPTDEQMLQ